jgi:hypothetical protein
MILPVYEVWRFNSRNDRNLSLGCWVSKLMFPSAFGRVPICVYMRHRSYESFVLKQQRKQYVSVVGGEMSDKNLEQRINIKFCVRIGKCDSEMLAMSASYFVWSFTPHGNKTPEHAHRIYLGWKKHGCLASSSKSSLYVVHKEIVHYEFTAQGQTVVVHYCAVLEWLHNWRLHE